VTASMSIQNGRTVPTREKQRGYVLGRGERCGGRGIVWLSAREHDCRRSNQERKKGREIRGARYKSLSKVRQKGGEDISKRKKEEHGEEAKML